MVIWKGGVNGRYRRAKAYSSTQPDSGSGGIPPRPTAVGTSDSGDGDFHLGQSLACVVIGTFPGGYLVELDAGKPDARAATFTLSKDFQLPN